jgi:hypothetical protein
MSRRPILKKKAARVRKALRAPLPRSFDLVQYLLDHKHAKTKRAAREMLVEGKVRSESHILGREKMPTLVKGEVKLEYVAQPYVPVEFKDKLTVLS